MDREAEHSVMHKAVDFTHKLSLFLGLLTIFCIVTFFMTFNYILFHNHIIALLIIIMPFIIFYIHFIIKLFIIKIDKIINLK